MRLVENKNDRKSFDPMVNLFFFSKLREFGIRRFAITAFALCTWWATKNAATSTNVAQNKVGKSDF